MPLIFCPVNHKECKSELCNPYCVGCGLLTLDKIQKGSKMSEKPNAGNPTVGRIVHYQRYGSPGREHKAEPSPAIITKVCEDGSTCHLAVFNPSGMYFNETPYSDSPFPGCWSWPPRN